MDIPEMTKTGKPSTVYKTDFEKGAFYAPLRVRTTANYPTKTPGVWYQLHGSLTAVPVLRAIGLDPETPCNTHQEAYDIISKQVQLFGADELEMKMVKLAPVPCPPSDRLPWAGIKVVELVRIIAGPVIGATLAALGADVIRVNCSRLPDINSLQLTLNAGVRTIDIDLTKDEILQRLMKLVQDADIFVQGYRPGVIAKRGLSLPDLLEMASSFSARPGWQQVGDAASGTSYVTARAMGNLDGRGGYWVALKSIRDRARNGGSYQVFASLITVAAYPLNPEVGLYSPDVVKTIDEKFKW
ncbi:alpha methylacyl-CoA racemase [Penicillium sp. IBT 16267x]|nr:alpha methylacyl-CoA racemase [Penicillium sp. IBT 16267x]